MPLLPVLFFLLFSLNAAGQVVLPDSVKNKIAQLNGEILLPLDAEYRNTSFFKNEKEDEPKWDVVLSDRKHKREIRYIVWFFIYVKMKKIVWLLPEN